MSIYLKVACYAALMGVWGFFAFCGKTEVNGFIEAIGAALSALGTIHAITTANKPSTPADPPSNTIPTTVVKE